MLIAHGRAVKSNNHMVEVDPLIESLYRWSDISGVLLMGLPANRGHVVELPSG